eukprot:6197866-Pleurochrysis_carterae.AAC.1
MESVVTVPTIACAPVIREPRAPKPRGVRKSERTISPAQAARLVITPSCSLPVSSDSSRPSARPPLNYRLEIYVSSPSLRAVPIPRPLQSAFSARLPFKTSHC